MAMDLKEIENFIKEAMPDAIIDKEPIIHIDDLIKSNTYWLEDYMDK